MEITTKELEEKIEKGEKIIVDFHGLWCSPCKAMKPIFEKVSSENNTEVQMYTMDVDQNRDMAYSLGIRSIPAVLSFSNGSVVDTKVGILKETEIKDLVNNLING